MGFILFVWGILGLLAAIVFGMIARHMNDLDEHVRHLWEDDKHANTP